MIKKYQKDQKTLKITKKGEKFLKNSRTMFLVKTVALCIYITGTEHQVKAE